MATWLVGGALTYKTESITPSDVVDHVIVSASQGGTVINSVQIAPESTSVPQLGLTDGTYSVSVQAYNSAGIAVGTPIIKTLTLPPANAVSARIPHTFEFGIQNQAG